MLLSRDTETLTVLRTQVNGNHPKTFYKIVADRDKVLSDINADATPTVARDYNRSIIQMKIASMRDFVKNSPRFQAYESRQFAERVLRAIDNHINLPVSAGLVRFDWAK